MKIRGSSLFVYGLDVLAVLFVILGITEYIGFLESWGFSPIDIGFIVAVLAISFWYLWFGSRWNPATTDKKMFHSLPVRILAYLALSLFTVWILCLIAFNSVFSMRSRIADMLEVSTFPIAAAISFLVARIVKRMAAKLDANFDGSHHDGK